MLFMNTHGATVSNSLEGALLPPSFKTGGFAGARARPGGSLGRHTTKRSYSFQGFSVGGARRAGSGFGFYDDGTGTEQDSGPAPGTGVLLNPGAGDGSRLMPDTTPLDTASVSALQGLLTQLQSASEQAHHVIDSSGRATSAVTALLANADRLLSDSESVVADLPNVTNPDTGVSGPMSVSSGQLLLDVLRKQAQMYADIATFSQDSGFIAQTQDLLTRTAITLAGDVESGRQALKDIGKQLSDLLKSVARAGNKAANALDDSTSVLSWALPTALVALVGWYTWRALR